MNFLQLPWSNPHKLEIDGLITTRLNVPGFKVVLRYDQQGIVQQIRPSIDAISAGACTIEEAKLEFSKWAFKLAPHKCACAVVLNTKLMRALLGDDSPCIRQQYINDTTDVAFDRLRERDNYVRQFGHIRNNVDFTLINTSLDTAVRRGIDQLEAEGFSIAFNRSAIPIVRCFSQRRGDVPGTIHIDLIVNTPVKSGDRYVHTNAISFSIVPTENQGLPPIEYEVDSFF